ncbi:hypothetical protein BDW74DRAFT_172604 [Aspergillus multicolor]|uniref:uncharacterized protein n=1 Tax=Aspergillus multicolor TaxID=41759 RepID=UPI003CCD7F65
MSAKPYKATNDYKAYYFPDSSVKERGVIGDADADADFDEMQPQNLDFLDDTDDLNDSSRAGNPAAAEPGGTNPRKLDVLEPGGYTVNGVEDEGQLYSSGRDGDVSTTSKSHSSSHQTACSTNPSFNHPPPKLANRRPKMPGDDLYAHKDSVQKPLPELYRSNKQKNTDADVDADDDLHKSLDMDPDSSMKRKAGLGARTRGMDVDDEGDLEPGPDGYSFTGVEDEGEQLNS